MIRVFKAHSNINTPGIAAILKVAAFTVRGVCRTAVHPYVPTSVSLRDVKVKVASQVRLPKFSVCKDQNEKEKHKMDSHTIWEEF